MTDPKPTSHVLPQRPPMPESRVLLETPGGGLWFDSQAEMDAWKSEPFWRKMLGLTAYDRKLNASQR